MPQYIADESRNYASQGVMQPGWCPNLDGVDDHIVVGPFSGAPKPLELQSGSWSVEWWMKPSASVSAVASCGGQGWILGPAGGGQIWYLGAWRTIPNFNASTFAVGEWHHYAFVFDSSSATISLYKDGVLVGTATGVTGSYGSDDRTVRIGRYSGNYYAGRLLDFRIHNRVLTAAEVFAVYDTTKGPGRNPASALFASNLIGHWKLDEPSLNWTSVNPDFFWDSSGNGNHGGGMGTIQVVNDVTCPCSFANESGYSPSNAASSYSSFPNLFPGYAGWAATGAASTALTNQSFSGRSGLAAAKFTNGAVGGYGNNRCDTNGGGAGLFLTTADRIQGAVFDVALSRPLVSGEAVFIYFTGSLAGPAVVLDASTMTGDPLRFQTFVATYVAFSAVNSQWLVVFPSNNVTGGDLTVYLDNVRYFDTGYSSTSFGMSNETYRYPGNILPQNSALPTKDVLGNTLTYPGPLPRNAALIDGFCGTFDGIDDRAATANTAIATHNGSSSFTATAWVYRINTGDWGPIFSKTDNATVRNWLLLTDSASNKLAFYSGGNSMLSSLVVPQNAWMHVAAVVSGNTVTLYQNGIATGSQTVNAQNFGITAPIRIGNEWVSLTPWGGRIVDARIYGSALSADDILSLYNGSPIAAVPVGHWPIQEGDGTTLYDVSGSGLHATLSNATLATFWGTRQPKVHRNMTHGYRLSGTVRIPALNSLVTAADGGAITNPAGSWHNGSESRIDFTGGVSNAPWLSKLFNGYMTTDGAGAGYSVGAAIVGKVSSALTLYARVKSIDLAAFRCLLDLDSGATLNRAQFGISTGGVLQVYDNTNGYQSIGSSQTTKLTDGNWHDLAFVWSATSVTAYLDNVALGTVAAVNLSSISSAWTRGGVLSDAALSGLKFKGNIARLIVAGTVMSSSMFGTANLLDLRFDNDINEDAAGRLATVPLSAGHTPSKVTVPTAYNFGDTLPEGMRKSVATNRESRFALMNTDR